MKKILLPLCMMTIAVALQAQPKVYINLNSHNETSGEPLYDATLPLNYNTAYTAIKEIADSVINKKVKWNFQSDVRFLLGALKHDPKSAATGNTNLLKWMDDSPYIECDPHSHEGMVGGSTYNYADVAHLHDSLGVTNRKNVGGFKIDGLQNGSDWQNFENGMACVKFTSAPKWKPNVMWGGSFSAGVHNDMNFYGSYKPQSRTNYSTHVNTNRVACQGNGCSAHFTDTTDENRIINQLKTLFTNVHNGTYDANQYYTQAVQFDCRDVSKTNFIKRLCTILDTVNNYVKKGWVEWATITEKDQYWRSASGLDSAYYFLDCDNLPASISAMKKTENKITISPNPASDILFITSEGEKIKQFEIYDMTGKIVFAASPAFQSYSLNVKDFDSGLYFLKVRSDNDTLMGTKFIVF